MYRCPRHRQSPRGHKCPGCTALMSSMVQLTGEMQIIQVGGGGGEVYCLHIWHDPRGRRPSAGDGQ